MNNKKIISLIIGIMCIVLSYGIVAQIKATENRGITTSTNANENQLRDEVLKAKEKYDNLYRALEEAEQKLEEERTNASQKNSGLTELENNIKEGNKQLGLTEVSGEGIIVKLDDNKKITLNSYLGDPNDLILHYTDVIRVINELKNAGAEAISINDQRIILTTSVECDGNVIKVNGVKIGAPFEIKAIGFPEYLSGAMNRQGGYLMNLKEYWGIETSVTKSSDITIPKYTGVIKYNYIESR
jgi:uncharacterized protein YlxW (UPF0749 family)